jgi:hypothetical protein
MKKQPGKIEPRAAGMSGNRVAMWRISARRDSIFSSFWVQDSLDIARSSVWHDGVLKNRARCHTNLRAESPEILELALLQVRREYIIGKKGK